MGKSTKKSKQAKKAAKKQKPPIAAAQAAAALPADCAPTPPSAPRALVVAAPDAFVLPHQAAGPSYSVASPGVLKNDFPETGVMPIVVLQPVGAGAGSVSMNGTGAFTYTPTNPMYVGNVTFTYHNFHTMSGSVSNDATVTLKIVNHPPEASPNWYLLVRGSTTYNIPVERGVLQNDYDPQGCIPLGIMLRATLFTPVTSGTLTLNFDGSFSYSPQDPTAPLDASFTYKANDSAGVQSAAVAVTLTFI